MSKKIWKQETEKSKLINVQTVIASLENILIDVEEISLSACLCINVALRELRKIEISQAKSMQSLN
ncbi:MAG: hypothetical protein AAF197_12410 [Pseudomonadota bacterium]